MLPVGVSIVGAGDKSAYLLTKSLLEHSHGSSPLFAITAVWDSDPKRINDFISFFSLKPGALCQRTDDALTRQEVAIAAICGASPASQPSIAAKAIHAGKHVWLLPGYPLSINSSHNCNLTDALSAYPSLVCIIASGFHYLPTFDRLRAELKSKLESAEFKAIRSISISVEANPETLFEGQEWKADQMSGGGVISQLGAPLLDTALIILLHLNHLKTSENADGGTSVIVQGRTAQLIDDYTNFTTKAPRLWPRTAEDSCWAQIDLKRRSCHSPTSMPSQNVVSLEILSAQTLAGKSVDPLLNIRVLTDGAVQFKTDGRSLWFRGDSDASQDALLCCFREESDEAGFVSSSIKYFVDMVATEMSQQISNDSSFVVGSTFQKLIKSYRCVSIDFALSTQRVIDAIKTSSLTGTSVCLNMDESNCKGSFHWSHCL